MKKFLLSIALCGTLAVQASEVPEAAPVRAKMSHNIDITAGGGIGSLDYKLPEGKTYPAYSWTAGIGYTWYFLPVLGLQTGVQVTRLGTIATMTGEHASGQTVPDSEGDAYIPYTNYTDWRDMREAYFIEVPLAFRVRWYNGNTRAGLHVAVGTKLCVPVSARHAHIGGVISHYGYYPEWDLMLRDLPERFTTEQPEPYSERITSRLRRWNAALCAELGTTVRCAPHTEFVVAAYAQYMVTEIAQPELRTPWAAGVKLGLSVWTGMTDEQKRRRLLRLAREFPDMFPCPPVEKTNEN